MSETKGIGDAYTMRKIIGDWCWGFGGRRIPKKKPQVTLELERPDWETLQLMAMERCVTPQAIIMLAVQRTIREWRET